MSRDIKDFKGVIPAVLSVFDKDENLDEQGTREFIRYLIVIYLRAVNYYIRLLIYRLSLGNAFAHNLQHLLIAQPSQFRSFVATVRGQTR